MANKSVVTKVTRFDKKDQHGNTSFLIEFRNGDKGYYNTKDENQSKFVKDLESEYEIEEKISQAGKSYFKITLPGDVKPQFKGGGGRPQVEPRIQMISFAAAYTKDLVVAGKFGMNDFDKEFNRIYNIMISKL